MILGGLAAMAFGFVFLVFIYAFASMIDPQLAGRARTEELLRRCLEPSNLIAILIGIGLLVGGFISFALGGFSIFNRRRSDVAEGGDVRRRRNLE